MPVVEKKISLRLADGIINSKSIDKLEYYLKNKKKRIKKQLNTFHWNVSIKVAVIEEINGILYHAKKAKKKQTKQKHTISIS